MAVGAGEVGGHQQACGRTPRGPGLVCWGHASPVRALLVWHPVCFPARGSGRQGFGAQHPLRGVPHLQYSLSTKRSSPDDGNDVSPYSLSPVSNKR